LRGWEERDREEEEWRGERDERRGEWREERKGEERNCPRPVVPGASHVVEFFI
jgi:hypothetical protein